MPKNIRKNKMMSKTCFIEILRKKHCKITSKDIKKVVRV